MLESRRVEGFGLHGGARASLAFFAAEGPTTLGRGDDRAELGVLDVRGSDRSTDARLPSGAEVRSIEHLLAAIAGIGAFDGLRVELEGDEVPLLDGASRAMVDAIEATLTPRTLTPRRCARAAVVTRAATIEVEGARFELSPALHAPSVAAMTTQIEVDVAYDEARFGKPLAGRAAWRGDAATFRSSIATARTFGAARELAALRARGLAAHVPEGAVVAIDLDDPARAPRDAGEPIRHKLLDLIGDLARLGAPVHGCILAHRPSHRATDAALRRALADSVIVVEHLASRLTTA